MDISYSSEYLEKITKGIINKRWCSTGVSIDTRTIKKGDLFCALKGKRFNGHKFIREALDKGASAILLDEEQKFDKNIPFIKVKNVLEALYKIAESRRRQSNAKFIGITGSVGKTGTKDMLCNALNKVSRVFANKGSLNNHIGTPLNIANIPNNIDFCIQELGMNKLGEIESLSRLLRPEVGIITAIEKSHLFGLKTLKKIALAKCEILNNIDKNGCCIFNLDTNYSNFIREKAKEKKIKNLISYGQKNGADIRLISYKQDKNIYQVEANLFGNKKNWCMPLMNEHWILNSLAVIAVGVFFNLNIKKILDSFSSYKVTSGRGNMFKLKYKSKKINIIDDTYNSNPASLKSALYYFKKIKIKGNRILVLGDMKELGKNSIKLHLEFVNIIQEIEIDFLFTTGKFMRALNNALPPSLKKYHAENIEKILLILKKNLSDTNLILLKGSNSMKLNQIVESLKKECIEYDL